MKQTMILLLLSIMAFSCHAFARNGEAETCDSLLTVFWNVENFFDYRSDSKPLYWTKRRFNAKSEAIAKSLFQIADKFGRYPDILAFAEIENRFVLWYLRENTLLRKLDYGIVHFDSPDHRGMDCGLLYRKSRLNLKSAESKHIYDDNGDILGTRDILLAEFDSLAVLVNHHPSKVDSGAENKAHRRELALQRMKHIADSLLSVHGEEGYGVISAGDFNDTLWPAAKTGTLKYNGEWEKIDGHFSFGDIRVEEHVFSEENLLTADRNFGGKKPKRTFSGPRYEGGISDHLPIVLIIYF